nr:hypothetical protein [uncultured Flavobacterium sp.]
MSKVHYFQRYHQKENVVTNNTLLLFSRLYNYSPNKFKQFIDALTDIEINVGVDFSQQNKSKSSVPDGVISQNSFKIVIETKLWDNFSNHQLNNHLEEFGNEQNQILLALAPQFINDEQNEVLITEISDYNSKFKKNIKFVNTTFYKIIETYKEVIFDYDVELKDIIDDFEDFCSSFGLLPKTSPRMLVIACGWTLKHNFQRSVYYDPDDRGYSRCTHLGIYKDKRVQGIGRIENIITAHIENDSLVVTNSTNEIATEEQKQNILDIIQDAKDDLGWNISTGHKFFCVDKFYLTEFRKNTPNGLFGRRYFYINDYIGEIKDTILPTEIYAKKLSFIDWEKNITK